MRDQQRLQSRAKLGKDIADVINPILDRYKIKKSTLAQVLHRAVGLAPSSTHMLIDSIQKGYTNQYLPYEDIEHKGLERLSIFFHMVRLEDNHAIIWEIQKMYSKFEYPPKNTADLPILSKLDENYI